MKNREILFKAITVGGNKWVEGSLFESHPEHHSPNVCIATTEFHPVGYGSRTWYDVIPETVCQFTGLLDKNGNKIWEGDLLSIGSNEFGFITNGVGETVKYEVRFQGCDYVLYRKDVKLIWGRLSRLDELNWNCQIVGNIHDHLLKSV